MGSSGTDLGIHCGLRVSFLGCLSWRTIYTDVHNSATWGPVSWTLVAEIFPLSIRAKGASIGASSNWVNNFAVAFFVPPMFEALEWGTYIFFAGFLGAGIIWVRSHVILCTN
jgi:hypothetical protein